MSAKLINNPLLVDNVDQELLASEVLAKIRPELEAIPEAELVRVNLDIPSGIALVLGALPEVTGLRPRIKAELPLFNLDEFDRMEEYALALNAAHASYLAATEPSDELRRVLEEAMLARETLVIDATALVQRGLLDARSVADLKGPIGHQNVATDLFHLVQAIRGRWPQVSAKSAVTSAELDRAEKLQQRLMRLVGLRDQSTPLVTAASDLRSRAFTKFWQTWDDIRRAASYLCWKTDDVDTIAPSLYAGRGGSKRKGVEIPPGVGVPAPTAPNAQASGQTAAQPRSATAANPAQAEHGSGDDPFLG